MQTSMAPPPSQQPARPAQAPTSSAAGLWVLGPAPPPVTGMTLLTRAVLSALEGAGNVRFFNWNPGMQRRSLWMRIRRNARMLQSALLLISHGRVRDTRLYMVSNMYSGLYFTALVVFVAKRLGYTIDLHHHVYSYIDDYDRRMAWIVRQMGPGDAHVVHAPKMIDDFRRLYTTTSRFECVYPSIVVGGDTAQPRETAGRPMRLGLLSSLSAAKGLSDVIATFETLVNRNRDVTLSLAGPVANGESQRLIDQMIAKYGGRVSSIGPVYDDQKRRFFDEIDVFLLPTKTESWGLVLNEALAAGVPVVTFDRGCTSLVVGAGAGRLIDRNSAFAAPAAEQIERWMDDNAVYARASHAAVEQASRLREEGQRMLKSFVQHMFSPVNS